MKCLGVDISRPLFEFLTSLSRQPPLVIQYNGCQRPGVSTRGMYGCKDAVQPSLAQFLDELRTWAASLGQAVQGCHEVPPRLICASLAIILKKCGMYTIEAEIGLAQMEKALAEQYCEQQAENFVPADVPLGETWVLYHQRDLHADVKSKPKVSPPHSDARSKSPEPWVLYHQRAAESGADVREAKSQTPDEASCPRSDGGRKREAGLEADSGERRERGDDVMAENPGSATVVEKGKEGEVVEERDLVGELEARNPKSLCTLMSESQTWVLYHQREDVGAPAEATPTAGTERVTAGREGLSADEEDLTPGKKLLTPGEEGVTVVEGMEGDETAGSGSPEAQKIVEDDRDEDLAILDAGFIQTRSAAAQRKRRASSPKEPPTKRFQTENVPQRAASSLYTETDKAAPTKSTSTSRGRRGKGSCGKPGQKLTLADLESQFGVIQKQAAKNLNVCATTLKRACRRHGIERWPRQETLEGAIVSVKSVAASEVTSQADSLADSAQKRASKSAGRPSREAAPRFTTPFTPPNADPPISENLEPMNLDVGPIVCFRSEPSFAELADFAGAEETAFHSVGGSLSEHTGPPHISSPVATSRTMTAGAARLTAGTQQLTAAGGWGKQGPFEYASPPSPDMSTLLEEFLTSEDNPFGTRGEASDELDTNLFSSALAPPDSSGAHSKGTVTQDAESAHGGTLYQDYQLMLTEPTRGGSMYTDSPTDAGPVFQEFQSMPSKPTQGHECAHAGSFYQPFQEMLHAPLEENVMLARSSRHPALARAHSTTNMRSYNEGQFMQPGVHFARGNVVFASTDGRSNWVRQNGPFPGGQMRRVMTDERQHGVRFAFPPTPSTSGTYDGPGFF